MYWTEMYASPQQAQRELALHARGRIRLTPARLAVAQVAARAKPQQLGSLKSFLKKVVKVANKADPLYSVRKKIDPVTKAVNRAVGIKQTSAPKTPPALIAPAAGTAPPSTATPTPITPTAPWQPDFSFAQGSGGGSSGGIQPAAAATGEDAGVPTWVWIAGAGAALLALYLLTKKR